MRKWGERVARAVKLGNLEMRKWVGAASQGMGTRGGSMAEKRFSKLVSLEIRDQQIKCERIGRKVSKWFVLYVKQKR